MYLHQKEVDQYEGSKPAGIRRVTMTQPHLQPHLIATSVLSLMESFTYTTLGNLIASMEIDHRGFPHRTVRPTFKLSLKDHIWITIKSELFIAAIAAIIYHLAGIPNISVFVIIIGTYIGWACVLWIRRDGVFDRQAEIDLAKAIIPKLLYIAVLLALRMMGYGFRMIEFILRVLPEDLIPSKTWSAIFIGPIVLLYFSGISNFSYLSILRAIMISILKTAGRLNNTLRVAFESFAFAGGWMLRTKVIGATLNFSTNARRLLSKFAKPLSPYEYTALEDGQIRLLRVERWIPFMGVRATLLHEELKAKPIYEAISYTWGKSKEEKELLINGHSFLTPGATYDTLYGRSSLWRQRLLWIDAICINQRDWVEKEKQVLLMTKIYKNASIVVVWLAHPSKFGMLTAYIAIALLHELGSLPNYVNLYRRYETKMMTFTWIAFFELFNNHWFTRVWIVQEVAAAKEVLFIYGGLSFTWKAVSSGLEAFRDPEMSGLIRCTDSGRISMQNICHFHSIVLTRQSFQRNLNLKEVHLDMELVEMVHSSRAAIAEKRLQMTRTEEKEIIQYRLLMTRITKEEETIQNRLSLPTLLAQFSSFDATRRRDKIFAFTGLAVDSANPAFAPNYADTVTVEEIYTNVARYILEGKDPLSVIAYAGIGSDRHLDLPSWAPDWTSTPRGASFTYPEDVDEDGKSQFSASKKKPAQVTFGPGTDDLKLEGFLVDEIASLGPVLISKYDDADCIIDAVGNMVSLAEFQATANWHLETVNLAMSGARMYDNKASTHQAFWRTLIGDRTLTTRQAPPTLYQDYLKWVASIQENAKIAKEFENGQRDQLPSEEGYWRRIQDIATWGWALGGCISERRFALTKAGYMAVVPSKSEIGDMVSIVLGAKAPLLLAELNEPLAEGETDRQAYMLVGECYVHGMMSGEMMDKEFESRQLLII